ncbi:hypothetical protein NCS57_00401600 [Fusarium keratoplasticum]|uniref:Uncharacterized protein n=1 Tax=Fusarium keratoplasticum TaxID=1328300 RepID=A0ACC0R6C8_9HYPO|nr:hypothetical protein NCS57_00401600 [Fusarium keratoplasticum]KAI8675020.1 hypothetical protein NCS57_00401600 [Fusarium keratoplasticum]
MAAAEQNGIDILCDAAGSDMLLSSLFALAAPGQDQQRAQPQDQHELQHPLPTASPSKQPHQQQVYHQQLDPALQPSQQETPRKSTSSLPAKRKLSDASASSPSHVCHICRRVYERADHLTRHLRSHENARPYQCSRCPKRFNRADLLTRHETTHDRDGAAKDRPFIRRNDRAAEACLNCAASKAKCEDQKPCSRCRNKSLTCQMPARRGNQYRTSESQAGVSPSDSSMVASATGNDNQVFTAGDAAYALSQSAVAHQVQSIDNTAGYASSSFLGVPSVEATPDETLYFAAPRKLLPDIELSWDTDFGVFTVPTSDVNGPSPRLGNGTKRSSRQPRRDMAQEDAAPQRSAWVADPDTNGQVDASAFPSRKVSSIIRDGLFAMVLADSSNSRQIPTFPSAETLSYLLETFFTQQDQKRDAFIHPASFDTSAATLELVSAIVSSGATSAPTTWQFGLALNEVLRTVLNSRLESFGSTAKPLMLLQASMLHLDIGQWCGFNRQMEMAQTFAQQVLTLVRETGRISFSSDSALYIPSVGDSPGDLELKWQQFATIESYKRLMMRLFIHDVQSSIVSWRSSNMAYNELDFTLPAAPDLWRAPSSQQWRELHSVKRSTTAGIPRLLDVRDCMSFITEPNDYVDIELCCMAALSGLWGQIWIYRDAVTYHSNPDRRSTGSPAWTKALYQDLYSRLVSFSNQAQGMQTFSPELLLFCELLMMTLHVSFDELHRLAGYNGEGGSRRAAQILEATWFSGPESRHAVWHAGQVLRYAQNCKATSLQGFNSMAVYFAGLTLWAYGIVSVPGSTNGQGIADDHVLLNGQETRESRAFLELGQGTPALTFPAGLRLQIEPLSNRDVALSRARSILRQNFPVLSEPLPQLVENLWRRLAELQSGQNGQAMANTDGTVAGNGPLHDELIFERLDDARLLRHYENNAMAWAGPLSTTDFLDVHFRLSTIPGEARAFEIWALRKPDDPLGIISSCATHLRDAIASRGKGVRMTGAVVISEIFTDPEYRTHGFAKLLLKRVQDHFDKRDDLAIDFTVIYGNGSLNWYRELGWKPVTATQLTINVERFQTCAECENELEFLTLQEVCNIADCDVNVSKLRLSKAQGPKTHVQLLPSAFLARRHLYRSALLAYKLRQGHTYNRHHGVSILEDEATEVSAWWVHDFQNSRLMIGRLFLTRLNNVDELVVEVLEAAMEEAARRGLREVVLWDPSPQVVVAAMTIWDKYDADVQVMTGERKEMVPCVRWKGGEERDVVLEEGQFVSWS